MSNENFKNEISDRYGCIDFEFMKLIGIRKFEIIFCSCIESQVRAQIFKRLINTWKKKEEKCQQKREEIPPKKY